MDSLMVGSLLKRSEGKVSIGREMTRAKCVDNSTERMK